MSTWHNLEMENVSFDLEERTVDIYVHSDNLGGVYLVLPFEQIKEIAAKMDIQLKEQP